MNLDKVGTPDRIAFVVFAIVIIVLCSLMLMGVIRIGWGLAEHPAPRPVPMQTTSWA